MFCFVDNIYVLIFFRELPGINLEVVGVGNEMFIYSIESLCLSWHCHFMLYDPVSQGWRLEMTGGAGNMERNWAAKNDDRN